MTPYFFTYYNISYHHRVILNFYPWIRVNVRFFFVRYDILHY